MMAKAIKPSYPATLQAAMPVWHRLKLTLLIRNLPMSHADTQPPAGNTEEKRQLRIYVISDYVMPLVLAMHQYGALIDTLLLIETRSKRGQVGAVKKQAEYLRQAHGWQIDCKDIKLDHNGESYARLKQDLAPRLRSWADRHRDHQLVFDITGGTKIMALVLHDIAKDLRDDPDNRFDTQITYTSTETEEFQWLLPDQHQEPMQVALDIRQFLEVSGYEVESILSDQPRQLEAMAARRELTENFMARQEPNHISILNAWANAAYNPHKNHPRPETVKNNVRADKASGLPDYFPRHILEELKDRGILSFKLNDGKLASITFANADWARYLSGGWLEEWAWWQVEDIPGLSRGLGVRIKRGETPNELDLVLCHRNRLLVVEAKTATLKGQKNKRGGSKRDAKEADVMYKIGEIASRLSHQAYGTKMLLSWQPLSSKALDRARQGALHVVAHPETSDNKTPAPIPPAQFRARIEEWMTQGRLPLPRQHR
ncbi:hypothetical protein CO611_10590 [Lysobacteraceae bacterium NML03-0222]|nr:hypothetical protein CO611_10590 [Xanthomonadaceae bacterium NML03-0222]